MVDMLPVFFFIIVAVKKLFSMCKLIFLLQCEVIKKFLLSLSSCLFLQSCANSNAPETQGLSLGFPSTGTVVRKLVVSNDSNFEAERFNQVAGDAAQLITTAKLDPLSRVFFETISLARSAAIAVSGSIEDDISKRKCLYEVIVDDDNIYDSVRSQIFFNSDSQSINPLDIQEEQIVLENGDVLPISVATEEEIEWWKRNKPPESEKLPNSIESAEKINNKPKSITIPQVCNKKILKDTTVFISFHTWGASIHKID